MSPIFSKLRPSLMVLALFAGAGLAACSTTTPETTPAPTQAVVTPAGLPTVTAIVAPSATVFVPTALPTFTPTPTAEAPTATPAVPATPDPNERVGDIIFSDPLDGSAQWFWSFEDDTAKFRASAETGRLDAQAKQSGSWRFTISNDTVKIGDQQIRVTAQTQTCVDRDEYGVMFRMQNVEGKFSSYVFKLRCNGTARAELLQGANVTPLTEWTTDPAIKTGENAENTLLVWAAQGQMRFYVNDHYLFTAQDTTLNEGFYGFFLYDRTNGTMTMSWKGLEARAIK